MNDTYAKLIISHQNKDTISPFFLSTYRFNSVFFTFILSKYRFCSINTVCSIVLNMFSCWTQQYIWGIATSGSFVSVSDSKNQFCKYFARTFSSISILCFPIVVHKVFLIVAIVVLANHSLNVLNTKAAVALPLILYGHAIFHAKFFNAIWVTVERLTCR